jgi:hypothetical protein
MYNRQSSGDDPVIVTPYFYDVGTRVRQTLSLSPIATAPELPWVGSQALSSDSGLIVHAKKDVLFTPEEAFNRILTQDKVFNSFLQDVIELRNQSPSSAEDDDLPATAYSITNAIYVSLLPRMALGSNWSRPHVTTDGYGGIRMSWIRGDREVRAVIPPDANPGTRRRYIYWDSGEKYGSVPNFTPSSLRAWLAWLQEENPRRDGFLSV